MLAELGFDGTYLTLWSEAAWQDVPKLAEVRSRHGLDVVGVYIAVQSGDPRPDMRRTRAMLESLAGVCSHLE
jgi:hypothetical protein